MIQPFGVAMIASSSPRVVSDADNRHCGQVEELAEAVVNQSVGLDALIRALPLDGEESSSSEGNTEMTIEDERKSELEQARALQEKSSALEEELRIHLAVRIVISLSRFSNVSKEWEGDWLIDCYTFFSLRCV